MNIVKAIIFGDESRFSPKQENYRKLFMYLVSGGLTTLTNWGVYILVDKLMNTDLSITVFGLSIALSVAVKTTLGWICSVLVAYFLNRITVFRSKGSVIRELIAFAGARIIVFFVIELAVFYLMLWACEGMTGVPVSTELFFIGPLSITYEYIVKLANSVFVVIVNYIMSKLMVFKKKDMAGYKKDEESSSKEAQVNA